MNGRVRRGRGRDLPALLHLEEEAFTLERREHAGTLRRALTSPHQEVWVAVQGSKLVAALFLRIYLKSVRIYSLAVAEEARGRRLVALAERRACGRQAERLTLEMDVRDERLLLWYEGQGFSVQHRWKDYYDQGWGALRLVKRLRTA